MRPITMEETERRREEILATIKDPTASHEQKVTYLARHAENFLTVLREPEELDALMEQWLGQYGKKIELVLSNNDDMALGAAPLCHSGLSEVYQSGKPFPGTGAAEGSV